MKLHTLNVLFSLSLLSIASAYGQDTSVTYKVVQESRKPYEIVITPTVTRTDLRSLIVQVEEDFYARFNELNIDDHYDVFCYSYLPTMSHISKRTCEPDFMIRARGDVASYDAFLLASGSLQARSSALLLSPKAMRKEVEPDYEILQEKMEELSTTDLELRSIALAMAKLKARLKNFGKED